MTERWWVIAESELRAALKRVDDGDDVDVAMLELVANSEADGGEGTREENTQVSAPRVDTTTENPDDKET